MFVCNLFLFTIHNYQSIKLLYILLQLGKCKLINSKQIHLLIIEVNKYDTKTNILRNFHIINVIQIALQMITFK